MLKRRISLVLFTLVLNGLVVGCENKEVNIEEVKTNSPIMTHSEIENEIKTRESMIEIYNEYSNIVSDSNYTVSQNYTDFLNSLSEAEQEKFTKYANLQGVNKRMVEKEANKEYMDEIFLEEINTLLNHMYFLPEGYEENRTGTEKFKSLNIEKTINDYLKENNITILEISKVENIDVDYSSLPLKTIISYNIKGTVNKTEFEEVITQEVYISPEDSEVLELDAMDVALKIDGLVTIK